ncbi:FAD-dependent oxidoreductase [Streptomyces sp. NPDC005925]|uniref:FAD-dependent oxidoreductase n=1 Tax=Streptomyces sp. NPDC005925 TaxID=3157172 RepID=UPI0033C2E5ED
MTSPNRTVESDVAVIGGGLGAVAAALAAARAGRQVVLVSPSERLGGQVTTQLVPALDEHPHVETGGVSASYQRFRALIREQFGGIANPGGGWVSRLCFEPAAADRAIGTLLAPHLSAGRLTLLRGLAPRDAVRDGDLLTAVRCASPEPRPGADGKPVTEVRAEIFLDATEAGDLLPLAGAPWAVGSEGSDAFGESLALPGGPHPRAVQSCTVGFVVEHVPQENHTGPEPEGYGRWRDTQPFTLDISGWDDRTHRYRMFTEGPDGHLPFWTYRRLRDGAALGGPDATLINWAGNDYAETSAIDDPSRAYAAAKHLSRAFLHWLRTECPRDDGGRGYPGLRLAPHLTGTPDGFAAEPYLRESRRLRTARPVRQQDLEPVGGSTRAVPVADAGGLAMYHMDLHARIGAPASAYAPTAPFQVPLSALVAEAPANLLAACKNLGATQVAASAYRVHHGEWAVGEAAGVLAAHCVAGSFSPARVLADRPELTRLQRRLVLDGVPLAWLLDVPPGGAPLAVGAHLLAAAGGLAGPRAERLTADPAVSVTERERDALLAAAARLLGRARPPQVEPDGDGLSWAAQVTTVGAAVDRALETPA